MKGIGIEPMKIYNHWVYSSTPITNIGNPSYIIYNYLYKIKNIILYNNIYKYY